MTRNVASLEPPEDTRVLRELGRLVATPGALRAMGITCEQPAAFLNRHRFGDWGEVCKEDARLNDEAAKSGLRVLSAYRLRDDTKIWIITEADRSATTILLPEEY